MAAPTLVNVYTAAQGRNTTTLTYSVPNVQVGDILVFKGLVEGQAAMGAPTTSGETWTNRASINTSGRCYARLDTLISTTSGTLAVSSAAPPGSNSHSGVVEHWRGAQLAATPATHTQSNQTNVAPSDTITTTGTDSVVSWTNGDYAAVAYGSRAWRSSATEEFVTGTAGSDYGAYFAYQAAATAGSQTYGLSAPSGQTPSMISIEVQGSGAPPAIPPILTMQTRRPY